MTRVLADTSVWVAHFRAANPLLLTLIESDRLLCHPLVVLEIACGTPPAPRRRTLDDLKRLRQGVLATPEEVLALIERRQYHDCGCGAVDMALLASVALTPNAQLWTVDKNLAALAAKLGVAFVPARH